jgi:hypothetical protein
LTTPIIEELLHYASKHAEKVGNKNLGIAAKHIANFVFNNGGEIPDITKRTPAEPTEAEKQLKAERETYAKEKLEGALSEVGTAGFRFSNSYSQSGCRGAYFIREALLDP